MTNTIVVSKNLVSPQAQVISKADFIQEYRYPADSDLRTFTYDVKPIYVLGLRGVAIAGRGYVIKEDSWSPVFSFEDLFFFPLYVETYFHAGKCDNSIYSILNKKLKPIKLESVITIIHFNFVYGHFLLEILPKLFILKDFFKLSERVPPLALPTDLPWWLKAYILEVWGDWEIAWFNPDEEYIRAEQTFIVTNDTNQRFFSKMAGHYLSFAEKNNSEIPQKIFISRPDNHPTLRILANFDALRTIAMDNGYKIVEPTALGSLQKQANLFNRCSIVLGEYTSALHNTLFSPYGTYVGCLNYLPAQIQSYIAAVHGHNLSYLLSDEGPVAIDYSSSEPIKARTFVISETKFIKLINDIENDMKNRKPLR